MNKNILKLVLENKKDFTPYLFTLNQISIMERYQSQKKLSNTQKAYLYSSIKRKIAALEILKQEYYIRGNNMLKDRVKKAKELLKRLKREKVFISGSFLFSKTYNDIDIYIISNKKKQYHKGKNHFIFITEKDLKKPLFQSAAKYSVSNFYIELKTPVKKRPSFNDLIMSYELAINEIIDNDDQKGVRDLIFEYYLLVNNIVLDSYLLNYKFNKIKKLKAKNKISFVNKISKELLQKLYSKSYLYNELSPFVKRIKKTMNEYKKSDNLKIYYEMLKEVKNESRRAKT